MGTRNGNGDPVTATTSSCHTPHAAVTSFFVLLLVLS